MANNQAIPTANLIVYINGRPFSLGLGLSFSSETPRKAIHGVDQAEAYELAPTTVKVNGSLQLLRAHGDGGLEGRGIIAKPGDLTREKYFTILIMDRFTKMAVFQSNQCAVMSQSWNIPVRGIITGSMTFAAITWSNEVPS